MNQSIIPSDPARLLSRWRVMETREPAHACAHLSRLFRPHRVRLPRYSREIRFRHDRIELGDASINALCYGEEVTIDAANNLADSYLVKFTLRGASEVRQQRRRFSTSTGTVCVLNPSLPLLDRMSADFEMLILQLDGPRLRGLLAGQLGIPLTRPLEFLPVSCPLSGPVASLARLVGTVCEDLAAGNSDMGAGRVAPELGNLLMHLVLLELPHSYSGLLRQDSGGSRAPWHLRRAEDYIHGHLDEPLVLGQISAAAGIGIRALQQAFRRYRGTTPTGYIRQARLERAHQLLADPGEDRSVSEVAADCGFTHLGRFARDYRRRFGVTPSVTRRCKCP